MPRNSLKSVPDGRITISGFSVPMTKGKCYKIYYMLYAYNNY